MKPIPDNSLTRATEWFARRRRGVMSLQEREDYETWSRNPGNSAAILELERIWDLANQLHAPECSEIEVADGHLASLARSALLAILCVVTLGVGMISYAGHSDFWTRLDWIER